MKYDVVIIGGGPAGMMAAGRAGELGTRVVLLEKNNRLGVKLLITGKGRCNITNQTEEKILAEMFGKNGKFLLSSLHRFGVQDVIDFFKSYGVATKVERGNRVFPESDLSLDVLIALKDYLSKSKVEVRLNSGVRDIIKKDGRIDKLILNDGGEIKADKYIICTGGKSYPATGSTGDGYGWLKNLGHEIIEPHPALTSIVSKEKFIKELEGLSLKNVEISIFKNNKKIDSRFGEAVFTDDGMSGPIILDLSKTIGELLPGVSLKIDFKPSLNFTGLDQRIQKDFQEGNNKLFKNILDKLLPQKLIPIFIRLSCIEPEKIVNLITREERKKLAHLFKEFSLEVSGLTGFERAVVTAGGVKLSEVDPKTMQSKIIPDLYFAGEILDLDGPTGGFNLQACWSTGYAAGENTGKRN